MIADYDEPIFFSDGFYWRNYGGLWYRSTYYTGGWVYAQPPVAVMRIDRPYMYRHYRPVGWVGRSPGQPRYVAPPPRTTTGFRGTPPPAYRGAPPPAFRGTSPAPAYRGAPPPAASARRPPPAPAARPATPPPQRGEGWRGSPR